MLVVDVHECKKEKKKETYLMDGGRGWLVLLRAGLIRTEVENSFELVF